MMLMMMGLLASLLLAAVVVAAVAAQARKSGRTVLSEEGRGLVETARTRTVDAAEQARAKVSRRAPDGSHTP